MYLILLLFGLFTHCVVISALYVYSSDESGNRNPSPLKTHKNWLVLPTFGPSVSVLQIMGWPSLKTGFRFNRCKQYCNTRSVTIVHIDRYIHSRFILSCFRILCQEGRQGCSRCSIGYTIFLHMCIYKTVYLVIQMSVLQAIWTSGHQSSGLLDFWSSRLLYFWSLDF